MAHFYFDMIDTGHLIKDDTGLKLPCAEDARKAVLVALGEIAKGELPYGGRRAFVIEVRDGSPSPVLRASLFVVVERPT